MIYINNMYTRHICKYKYILWNRIYTYYYDWIWVEIRKYKLFTTDVDKEEFNQLLSGPGLPFPKSHLSIDKYFLKNCSLFYASLDWIP